METRGTGAFQISAFGIDKGRFMAFEHVLPEGINVKAGNDRGGSELGQTAGRLRDRKIRDGNLWVILLVAGALVGCGRNYSDELAAECIGQGGDEVVCTCVARGLEKRITDENLRKIHVALAEGAKMGNLFKEGVIVNNRVKKLYLKVVQQCCRDAENRPQDAQGISATCVELRQGVPG